MSISDNELGQAVARLAATLLPRETLASTLETVAELTCKTIPACRASSISLVEPNGEIVTVAVTDPLAAEMDELQYRHRQGPCLEAITTSTVVRVPDLHQDGRFPRFAAAAAQAGVSAVLSLPLPVDGKAIGGLNLYAGATRVFDEGDQVAGERLAGQAAVVVANAAAYDQAARLVQQLQTAMASRAEIEQAKGIVMSRSKVGPEEAFDVLRRMSQRENVKLRDVARRIVESAGRRA